MKVARVYDVLFQNFGNNARTWLFFYYDEEDVSQTNWLCRTEWTADQPYRFIWTKNYYQNRMRGINEQASRRELFERCSVLLNETLPIYSQIAQCVKDSPTCLSFVIKSIRSRISDINRIATEAQNVPYGSPDSEQITSLARNFIFNVEWLANDMLFFDNRGDALTDGKRTYYLLKSLYLDKCEKSKTELEKYYQFTANL